MITDECVCALVFFIHQVACSISGLYAADDGRLAQGEIEDQPRNSRHPGDHSGDLRAAGADVSDRSELRMSSDRYDN